MNHTEHTVIGQLEALFSNYKYRLNNTYIFHNWESDFFCVSDSGYHVECEVKVTRGDFFDDFKYKPEKHRLFKQLVDRIRFRVVNAGPSRYGGDFLAHVECGVLEPMDEWRARNLQLWLRWELRKKHFTVYAPASEVRIYDIEKISLPHQFYYAVPTGMVQKHEVPEYAGLIYCDKAYAEIVKRAPYMHKRQVDVRLTLLKKYYNIHEYDFRIMKRENEWMKRRIRELEKELAAKS